MTKSTHSTWRKLAVTTATFALMAGGLAACSGGDSGSGSESGSAGAGSDAAASADGVDDGTKITMWTRAPLERQAKAAVEAYNASHKNQVELTIQPNDDMEGLVGAAVQNDSLPDILGGDVVRIPAWTSQGVFADVTDRIDALPNVGDLQKGHIEAGTVDGAKHTLPFVTDVSVMVWNKDLYKEAGLDPEVGPKNMKEFVEHAKKIAALNKDGVAGTYIAGQSGGALVFKYLPMIWGDGEEALSADGKESLVNNASAKAVYEGLNELVNTPNGVGAGSKEETGATWTAPFSEGKIGVMPYPNTSATALFEDAPFEVGVAPIGGALKGEGSTFLGGDAIGISNSSKNVDQVWNFMAWLMSDEAQTEVFAKNGDTASNTKTLESAYADADERVKTINSTIGMAASKTPISVNFSEAFNAAGSPWQLLFQDQVWNGDSSKLDSENDAITAVLGQ